MGAQVGLTFRSWSPRSIGRRAYGLHMEPPSRRTTRIVVLASGTGSNLQAILDACVQRDLPARVVVVVSDQPAAYALARAGDAGVPAAPPPPRRPGEARADYDTRLAAAVGAFEPDLVVLAGWMRVLTMKFLGAFPNKGRQPPSGQAGRVARNARRRAGVRRGSVRSPHRHRRDGPLRARRGCRRRPGRRHRRRADPTLPTRSTTSRPRVHAAEHDLLVAALVDHPRRHHPPPRTSPHARPNRSRTHEHRASQRRPVRLLRSPHVRRRRRRPRLLRALPDEVDIAATFAADITLAIPIVSAAMDKVTECRMAIAMARHGGIGVIHRNMSLADQAAEVQKVKRSQSGMITDPVTLPPTARCTRPRR